MVIASDSWERIALSGNEGSRSGSSHVWSHVARPPLGFPRHQWIKFLQPYLANVLPSENKLSGMSFRDVTVESGASHLCCELTLERSSSLTKVVTRGETGTLKSLYLSAFQH